MNTRTATAILASAIMAMTAGAPSLHASDAPSRVPASTEILAARPALVSDNSSAAFHMAPLTTYSEVLSRPLFTPDRRAHEAPGVAAVPQTFTLRGIVVLPASTYALVEEGKTSRRVTEGQSLGGGTVKQILRDRIVLNVNGVDTAVKLFDTIPNGKSAPGLSTAGGIPSQLPPDFQPPAGMPRPPLSGG